MSKTAVTSPELHAAGRPISQAVKIDGSSTFDNERPAVTLPEKYLKNARL